MKEADFIPGLKCRMKIYEIYKLMQTFSRISLQQPIIYVIHATAIYNDW